MIVLGRSLYLRLVIRVGLVLVVSAVALLIAIWFSTRLAANAAYDRILTGSALSIAENTWYNNGAVNVDAPISAFSMLSAGDQVFYAVIDPDGRTVAGDPEFKLPIPWNKLADGPLVIRAVYLGLPVSIAIIGRRMPVAGPNPWAVIMVAQTNNGRESFTANLAVNASLVIIVMGLVTVIAAMFTLYQALSPLKNIGVAIQRRDLHDLSPLNIEVPAEIHPLISSINQFMHRLTVHRELMRRVIGDAAHQLRTPVTALISQTELLSMQTDDGARQRTIARLSERTHDLGTLVNQLINHAMVQHRADSVQMETLDLAKLARDEMTAMLSHFAQRDLDIAMLAPDVPCLIVGDKVSIREGIKNILGNALQYGAPTRLHLEIVPVSAYWELQLRDDGPGIAKVDWDRIRKPFSARSGDRLGASLGLSIVEEVMRAHHGYMRFEVAENHDFIVALGFKAIPSEPPTVVLS
ncbi:sensor histidine kinase [Glaciimonas sp. PCH181]|uniref:sensor histidine kinase n=1 Tax=Glaciimonas sp. PCH181 TaxID=2133943 RepID=UPI000D3C07CF|nr:sensor histidine kinase [Glaciimonas sp. PCH181]PUA17778.1 sensor histidine kinase [Glaciimonas sp. PCH181]